MNTGVGLWLRTMEGDEGKNYSQGKIRKQRTTGESLREKVDQRRDRNGKTDQWGNKTEEPKRTEGREAD